MILGIIRGMKGDEKMEYIDVEQFLEQPKEVQQSLLDWWQPCKGDICFYKNCDLLFVCNGYESDTEDLKFEDLSSVFKWSKEDIIPLFTETQLRKFIEDETFGDMTFIECLYYSDNDNNYGYLIKPTVSDNTFKEYKINTTDLLQAYWKVACEVAKEVIG